MLSALFKSLGELREVKTEDQLDHYLLITWPYQILFGALLFILGTGVGFVLGVLWNVGKTIIIRPFS